MGKRRTSMSDQIRQAIDASDKSRYRICQLTDIAESNMSRFMAGGWLGQDNINALAKLLGLSVKTEKRKLKGR